MRTFLAVTVVASCLLFARAEPGSESPWSTVGVGAQPSPSPSPSRTPGKGTTERTRRPKKVFRTSGRIYGPGVLLVTSFEFMETCPQLPVTQGVSHYVIELPPAFRSGDSLAIVAGMGTGPPLIGSRYNLSFLTEDCSSSASTYAPSVIPEGTRFVEVSNFIEGDTKFEFRALLY